MVVTAEDESEVHNDAGNEWRRNVNYIAKLINVPLLYI